MSGTVPEKRLLLSVTEAAELCGYSRSFLYEQITRGALPVIRLGRTCRIPAAWLEKWVAEHVAAWERARGGEA